MHDERWISHKTSGGASNRSQEGASRPRTVGALQAVPLQRRTNEVLQSARSSGTTRPHVTTPSVEQFAAADTRPVSASRNTRKDKAQRHIVSTAKETIMCGILIAQNV